MTTQFRINETVGWVASPDGDWLVPNDQVLIKNTVAIDVTGAEICEIEKWLDEFGPWAWITRGFYITFRNDEDAVRFALRWAENLC